MHFSLIKIRPSGGPPSHGLDDVILPVFFALKSLGYEVEIRADKANPRSRNIVFGSCLAPRRVGRELPSGSILFNLEQLNEGNKWCNREYLAHLADFSVWDYSPANIETLARLGVARASLVPPGYVPEMTRLRRDCPRDVDVLFYGLINERRHAVIKKLCDAGIRTLATQEAFGNLRDSLLARSRLLLNIHYYLPARLETARLGYVFANHRAVVSERREDTEIPAGLEESCAFFPYEDLVDGVRRMLADEGLRRRREEAAFEAFTAAPLVRTLENLLGRRRVLAARPTSAAPSAAGSPGEGFSGERTPPLQEWLISDDSL